MSSELDFFQTFGNKLRETHRRVSGDTPLYSFNEGDTIIDRRTKILYDVLGVHNSLLWLLEKNAGKNAVPHTSTNKGYDIVLWKVVYSNGDVRYYDSYQKAMIPVKSYFSNNPEPPERVTIERYQVTPQAV